MRKIMTSYATEGYYQGLDQLAETAIRIGRVDEFIKHRYDELKETEFFTMNKHIISRPTNGDMTDWGKIRSAQYWIWKPYIILETMNRCDDGDIILYADAGMKVVSDLNPLYEITERDNRMLFSASQRYGRHLHSEYTKRDCFVLMGLDEPQYWNARMINGAVSSWKKTPENIAFLSEWRKCVTDARIVTDDHNTCGLPDFPDFIQHRFDQAILSLLSLKYNCETFRDPSQYSINEYFPNSPYGLLFHQHNIHLFS